MAPASFLAHQGIFPDLLVQLHLPCKEDFLKWNNVVPNPLVILKPLVSVLLIAKAVLVCGTLQFNPAGLLLFEALCNFLSQRYMVLNVCFALKWKEVWKCMLLLFSSFNLCSKVRSLRPLIICLCLNSLQFTSIFLVLKCLQMNEELYCFILFFLIRMLVKAHSHRRQKVV